jgi:hypothetical protein
MNVQLKPSRPPGGVFSLYPNFPNLNVLGSYALLNYFITYLYNFQSYRDIYESVPSVYYNFEHSLFSGVAMGHDNISRLTSQAVVTLCRYAEKYKVELAGGFTNGFGDTMYFMLAESNVTAFIHCTPYGYLVQLLVEGIEEEVWLAVKNIRSFMSRLRRVLDGDMKALIN